MKALESSSLEDLEGQVEGTRFFVIQFMEPQSGLYVRGSIALSPQKLQRIKEVSLSVPPEQGGGFNENTVPMTGAMLLLAEIYGTDHTKWPPGWRIEEIEEVSKEDLLKRVRERDARRQSSLAD